MCLWRPPCQPCVRICGRQKLKFKLFQFDSKGAKEIKSFPNHFEENAWLFRRCMTPRYACHSQHAFLQTTRRFSRKIWHYKATIYPIPKNDQTLWWPFPVVNSRTGSGFLRQGQPKTLVPVWKFLHHPELRDWISPWRDMAVGFLSQTISCGEKTTKMCTGISWFGPVASDLWWHRPHVQFPFPDPPARLSNKSHKKNLVWLPKFVPNHRPDPCTKFPFWSQNKKTRAHISVKSELHHVISVWGKTKHDLDNNDTETASWLI